MNNSINDRFTALPPEDQRLVLALAGSSPAVLVVGIFAGLMTALARGGMLNFLPETGYRFLTVHGTSIFFYWLYLAPTGLLAGFAAIENQRGLLWRGLARAGFLAISGFAALQACVPGTLWALGLAAFPAGQQTLWHILFHNMRSLPLMASVQMWYVLIQAVPG